VGEAHEEVGTLQGFLLALTDVKVSIPYMSIINPLISIGLGVGILCYLVASPEFGPEFPSYDCRHAGIQRDPDSCFDCPAIPYFYSPSLIFLLMLPANPSCQRATVFACFYFYFISWWSNVSFPAKVRGFHF
jgi:hypothetical protein